MNSKRMHFLLIGAVVLMIGSLIGGTYLVNSMLTKKANELTALKAKSAALDEEQLSLKKAKKDLANYAELYKITRAVVPEEKNQAEAAREIVNIANDNGISLASITFPASSLGTTTGGGTATQGATAPPVNANSKTVKLSQLTPVKGISGVYNLVITVNSDTNAPVPYNQFVNFLNDLEHNRHTAQVSSITLQPDKNNRNLLSFTLNLNEYIKP